MRKSFLMGLALVGLMTLMTACKGDSITTGDTLLDAGDSILVLSDTVSIGTQLDSTLSIISSPDSFLLGEMATPYGTIEADILTQFACPVGYRYPETAELDSMCLLLYYSSWTGDGNSPLQIDVREMDRQTLIYARQYNTDIRVEDYCDLSNDQNRILENRSIVSVSRGDSLNGDGTYRCVRLKVDNAWATKFWSEYNDFSNQDAYNDRFHGLFITSTFGGGTVMHVSAITLAVYYHFSYEKTDIVDGQIILRDTVVADAKAFYANTEVRQVNRIHYFSENMQEQDLYKRLSATDTACYVISPAGIYTRISIPIRELASQVFSSLYIPRYDRYKRPYVNLAKLQVNVLNTGDATSSSFSNINWTRPAPYMLLVKEYAKQSFFEERLLPSDTLALLGTLISATDSLGFVHYNYTYDLSTLLTQNLRMGYLGTEAVDLSLVPDSLHLVLIPVDVESGSSSNGSSTVTRVTQSQVISGTVLASKTNKKQPLSLEVVYSGF